MEQATRIIYICQTCLRIAAEPEVCHDQPMSRCDVGAPGSERSKPVMTPDGELMTHAPLWWVERCLSRWAKAKKAEESEWKRS